MLPSVTEQLRAIKFRLEETIIPEIPEASEFARDQANFILATLSWILEINEHQYRYEVVENREYREGLSLLLNLAKNSSEGECLRDHAERLLASEGPEADEGLIPLASVESQNRQLKKLVAEMYKGLVEQHPDKAEGARSILKALALRQGERDRAFYRKTGYLESTTSLADILYKKKSENALSPNDLPASN